MTLGCNAVGGGGVQEGTVPLVLFSALLIFSYFLHCPQANWALLVLIPRWVGLCMFWDPVDLSNELSTEAEIFSHWLLNLHRCFQSEGWGFISPCRSPGLHGLSGGPPAAALPTLLHNPPPHWVLQPLPCHESSLPGCPSPPLLPVWMNVSSLIPWLSDFQVWFSVSSGCFLFLNCCCPSFGCAQRHSVSTYGSILAGSPLRIIIICYLIYLMWEQCLYS